MRRERDNLELADIQGNILRGYNLPHAHYYFYRFDDPARARDFVDALSHHITTADDRHHEGRWSEAKPDSTLNLAFTFEGLKALAVPLPALDGFPEAFREGMRARAGFLVDRGPSAPERWDDIWRSGEVHACVTIYGSSHAAVEDRAARLERQRSEAGGVERVAMQDAAALEIHGETTAKEHFGYADGFGNPDVEGSGAPHTPGRGGLDGKGRWVPLKPGEFILGQIDENGEIALPGTPRNLFRNGTFMVYRKLHQNVGSFRTFLREESAKCPGGEELFKAKLVGRWADGTPLSVSPRAPDPKLALDPSRNADFVYGDDPAGERCPMGAHIRRANPRDAQGFGGTLANRHRIIRRGVPYGTWIPLDDLGDDDGEHGLIFVCYQADIERQFEFVQQQWLNYGNDQNVGNDKDALVGSHLEHDHVVITGSGADGARPVHVVSGLRPFVETRGGDYFFVPGITAIHMLSRPLGDGRSTAWRRHHHPLPRPKRGPPVSSTPGRWHMASNGSLLDKLKGLVSKVEGGIEHHLENLKDDIEAHIAHADLEPLFRILRPVAPIVHLRGQVLVLRRDDVLEVLSNDQVFQAPYRDKFKQLTEGGEFFLGLPNDAHYERDTAIMRLAIRRDDVEAIVRPFVQRKAAELLDQAGGSIDVVSGLGAAVPTALCGHYFGAESPPDGSFAPQSAAISAYVFLPTGSDEGAAMEAAKRMREVIRKQIEARKGDRGKRDDVLERLLAMQDAKMPGIDDRWLLDNLFGFVVAAIPTTAASIARVIDELLKRPTELEGARLAAEDGNRKLVGRYANECLRFNPLGAGVFREVVAESYTIAKGTGHGKTVERGEVVLAALLSAMFDEKRIHDPNSFRTDRPAYEYLHNGYGLHTCFGQYINAVQVPSVIAELLKRRNLRRAPGEAGKLKFKGAFPDKMTVEFDT